MNNRYREEEQEQKEKQTDKQDQETVERPNEEVEVVDKPKTEEENFVEAVEEIKRLNDLYLRTLAETENFKKRLNEERLRERKYASQYLLEKLINVLDIFDKAVSIRTDDPKLKNFLIGFEMINTSLKQIMEEEGIKKMNSIGQKFNPMYHHAVETDSCEEKEDDIVLEETQSGFMYKDRVLRPAMVKVNKKNQTKMEE